MCNKSSVQHVNPTHLSPLCFPEVAEEFFEYDAEEFLVSLTLLITEGRTPECSVKGRTEGLHCPPAQSGMPMLTKHECSDKLPQVGCFQPFPGLGAGLKG